MSIRTSPIPRVALLGIKHSGKSSVARKLGTERAIEVIDTDELICEAYQVDSPRELYRCSGAERFREAELHAITTLSNRSGPLVVATGGGLADNGSALAELSLTFYLVYLAEGETVLYHRVMAGGRPPFLPESGTKAAFSRLYRRRDTTYRRWANAVVQIDGASIDSVAAAVQNKIDLFRRT